MGALGATLGLKLKAPAPNTAAGGLAAGTPVSTAHGAASRSVGAAPAGGLKLEPLPNTVLQLGATAGAVSAAVVGAAAGVIGVLKLNVPLLKTVLAGVGACGAAGRDVDALPDAGGSAPAFSVEGVARPGTRGVKLNAPAPKTAVRGAAAGGCAAAACGAGAPAATAARAWKVEPAAVVLREDAVPRLASAVAGLVRAGAAGGGGSFPGGVAGALKLNVPFPKAVLPPGGRCVLGGRSGSTDAAAGVDASSGLKLKVPAPKTGGLLGCSGVRNPVVPCLNTKPPPPNAGDGDVTALGVPLGSALAAAVEAARPVPRRA